MIKKLYHWFQSHKASQVHNAIADGYGWAWSAFRIEGYPLSYIVDKAFCEFDDSPRGRNFDRGVQDALADIDAFLRAPK